ncbi:trehalase [Amanita rubescens]|nr:trehalase [Amanita rubescens]
MQSVYWAFLIFVIARGNAQTTAVPSPTASLTSQLPSQAPLPPKQSWCPSDIFCAGALLQTVDVANVYPDSKTFVDKPTSKSPQQVLSDFNNISTGTTYGEIVNFLDTDFSGEGQELEALSLSNFNSNPPFLQNVTDSLLQAWSKTVHGYWTQLIRGSNDSRICESNLCQSTFIPLNHSFVIPGGRFREQYYWDSFWIIEGLIQSQLLDIANGTLQNFMDELDLYGFIPNGGRIYYLDRSQPPLFIQMLARYVAASGDNSILGRALPMAEKELSWWDTHRSIRVTSPFSNQTFKMYRYDVNNSAPRPESYLSDYTLATSPDSGPTLNETEQTALYAELASGAETGWDYSTRFFYDGSGAQGLRSLNVRGTVPVDLNSILYKNHVLLAGLYGSSNQAAAERHLSAAAALNGGILDLFWDSTKLAFYDFNLRTNARNTVFSAATFYPLWSGIIPLELVASSSAAFGFFSSLNMVLNRYNGTFPVTFNVSGQQWDAPNAWPPHQYIILQALNALPSNVTSGSLPTPNSGQSTYSLIPSGQIGIQESDLLGQPIYIAGKSHNASSAGSAADINTLSGTVINGGNATTGEGWASTLQRELANRYFTSAFCSWYSTGGSISGVLPQLSAAALNVTQSVDNTGNMFEKFSILDVDSSGRGGEYTVQVGFGWTNGVVLWTASNYGNVLVAPKCPNLLDAPNASSTSTKNAGAGLVEQFSLVVSISVILITSALTLFM